MALASVHGCSLSHSSWTHFDWWLVRLMPCVTLSSSHASSRLLAISSLFLGLRQSPKASARSKGTREGEKFPLLCLRPAMDEDQNTFSEVSRTTAGRGLGRTDALEVHTSRVVPQQTAETSLPGPSLSRTLRPEEVSPLVEIGAGQTDLNGRRAVECLAVLESAAIDIPSPIGSPNSVATTGATPTVVSVLPTKQRRSSASVFASHGSAPSVAIDVGLPTRSSVSEKSHAQGGARGPETNTVPSNASPTAGNITSSSTPPTLDSGGGGVHVALRNGSATGEITSAAATRTPMANQAATKRMMLLDYSDVEAAFFHSDFFHRRRAAAFLALVLRSNEYAANVLANIHYNPSQWKLPAESRHSFAVLDGPLRLEGAAAEVSQHLVQLPVPSQFLDPVTRRVMTDPVVFIDKAVLDRPSAEGLVFRLFVTMAKCQAAGSQKRREFFASNPESVVSSSVTRQLFHHVLGPQGLALAPRPGLLRDVELWCQSCLSQSAPLRSAVEDVLLEEVARRSSANVASETIALIDDTNAERFALDSGSIPVGENHQTIIIRNLRQGHPQQRECLEHVQDLDVVVRKFTPRPWELSFESMWREACEKSVRTRKHTAASRKHARLRRVSASAPSSPAARTRDQSVKPSSSSSGVLQQQRSSSGRSLHAIGDGSPLLSGFETATSRGLPVADDGGVGGIAVGVDCSSFGAEGHGNAAENELLRKQSSARRSIEEDMQRELTLLRLMVPPVHHPVIVRTSNSSSNSGGAFASGVAGAAALPSSGEAKAVRTIAIGVVAVPTAVSSASIRVAAGNQAQGCKLRPQKPTRGGGTSSGGDRPCGEGRTSSPDAKKSADVEGEPPLLAIDHHHHRQPSSALTRLVPKPPSRTDTSGRRAKGAVADPAGRNHTKPHIPVLSGFVVAPSSAGRRGTVETLPADCGALGGRSSGNAKTQPPTQPRPLSPAQDKMQAPLTADTVADIPAGHQSGPASTEIHNDSCASTEQQQQRQRRISIGVGWRDHAFYQAVREEFPGALESTAELAAAAVHPNPKHAADETAPSSASSLSLEERSLVSAVMQFHQDASLFDAVMNFHAPWFLELEARALAWSEATFAAIAEAQERARVASANQHRQRRPTAPVHKCSIGYSAGSAPKHDEIQDASAAPLAEHVAKAATTVARKQMVDSATPLRPLHQQIATESSHLAAIDVSCTTVEVDVESQRLSGGATVGSCPVLDPTTFSPPQQVSLAPPPLQSTVIVPSDVWRQRLQDEAESGFDSRFIAARSELMHSPRCLLRGTPQSAPGIRLLPPTEPSARYVSAHAKVLPGSAMVRDPNTEIPAEYLLREQERLYAVYDEAQVRQEVRRRRELGMFYFEPIMASDERQRLAQLRHDTVRKNLSAASAKALKARWEAALRQGGDRDVLQAESGSIPFVDLPESSAGPASSAAAVAATERSLRSAVKETPTRPFSSTLSARSWLAALQPATTRSGLSTAHLSLEHRLSSSPTQHNAASRKFRHSIRVATKYDKELEKSSPLLPKVTAGFERPRQ